MSPARGTTVSSNQWKCASIVTREVALPGRTPDIALGQSVIQNARATRSSSRSTRRSGVWDRSTSVTNRVKRRSLETFDFVPAR